MNTKWHVKLLFDNGRTSNDEFSDIDDALEFWSMVKRWDDVAQGTLASFDEDNGEEILDRVCR